MSGIGGKVREQKEFGKKVGIFVGRVLTINPDREEYKDILGIELDEKSKATDYLGQSDGGNTSLRVNIWLEDVKGGFRNPVSFYLEDKLRSNKDGSKDQYINNVGVCSWAPDEKLLPDWFIKTEYRKAHVGEEELYNFLRNWLGKIDFRSDGAVLQIDWKKLMKGDVRELKAQINGEYSTNVGAAAIVKTVVKEGEDTKEYQGIYNKAFIPEYSVKHLRLVDYSKKDVQEALYRKKSNQLKPHERFVMTISNEEHGCKDSYSLKDLKDYDPNEFLVASNAPMSNDGSDY